MFSYLLALSPLHQSLLRIDITTGESSTLVDGLTDGPDGIVVDPDRKYIYWTNMGPPGLPEGRVNPPGVSGHFVSELPTGWWGWCSR
jgi:hypothetical protein